MLNFEMYIFQKSVVLVAVRPPPIRLLGHRKDYEILRVSACTKPAYVHPITAIPVGWPVCRASVGR